MSESRVSSNLEADLTSLCWSARDLHTLHWNIVIVEISSAHTLEALNNPQWFPGLSNTIERTRQALNCFQNCYVEVVNDTTNRVAEKIAVNVTKDGRFQSYIARGGRSWSMIPFLKMLPILHLHTQDKTATVSLKEV
ncbi:hypothetical protein F2Q70_00012793 [Brassica cretica]|uniref:RNase H type-1 domain-containing protein n=1 Tax=Brassica cretica TaxID=69181 RepID=A0A8S9M7T5_BRACR|nr:hypothetical protein F2Q70_00012793 [Brassica cretica]